METLRKKHELRNYDFCYGMGANWVDMEKGMIYYIQQYRDDIDCNRPTKGVPYARYTSPDKIEGYIDPDILRERMKDPEPDPRY